jgi:type IV fimbrial biogenesis protein FimT
MNAPLSTRGFTLIELMIAMMIGVLLLMQGLPSFTTFLRNSEIRSTSESIVNGLRTARAEATHRNVPGTFSFTAGAGNASWAINQFNPATATLINPPIQQYAKLEAGKSSLVTTTPATAVSVTFNGLGRIISPSPMATPNLQQIDVASVVSGEARPLRIYVENTRGIRMCDPDPALLSIVPPDARAC